MNHNKKAFIEFSLAHNVLQFGEFVLKSGRVSPYFFNTGLFYRASALHQLGEFYARTLIDAQLPFDGLFGPAYKGLPLATTTAVALATKGIDCHVTFNRKEIKDHGEKGLLMGAPLKGNIIMIDDVITAGTAFRETQRLIDKEQANLIAIIIAFDRCEKNANNESTVKAIEASGIRVLSLINFFDIMAFLKIKGEANLVDSLLKYHHHYGIH